MQYGQAKSYKLLGSLSIMVAWFVLSTCSAQAGTPTKKTTVRLIVTNAQGTVVATMTPQGQVTYTAAYRPYGKQAKGTPKPGPGYTGHVNDPATGLVYMQQRYYDPTIQRFISPDPIGPTPGNIYNINRYVYAADNPIRYTDPDGRCIDGVTCASMLSNHVKWRMSHPNAPADGLEKVAFVGVGVMAAPTAVTGGLVLLRSPLTYLAFSYGTKDLDVVEAMKAAEARQRAAELVQAAKAASKKIEQRIEEILEQSEKKNVQPPPPLKVPNPPPPPPKSSSVVPVVHPERQHSDDDEVIPHEQL